MFANKCQSCDRTFSKLQHLKRHRRAHTGERPFKCAVCGKHFARRDVLLRHSRAHSVSHIGNDTETMPPSSTQSNQPSIENSTKKQTSSSSLQPPPAEGDGELCPVSDEGGPTPASSGVESMPVIIVANTPSNAESLSTKQADSTGPANAANGQDSWQVNSDIPGDPITQWQPSEEERDQLSNDIVDFVAFDDLMRPLRLPEGFLCDISGPADPEIRCDPYTLRLDDSIDLDTGRRLDETTLPSGIPQTWLSYPNRPPPVEELTSNISNTAGEPYWARPAPDLSGPKRIDMRQSWPSRPRRVPPLMPALWNDVASCTSANILSQTAQVGSTYRSGLGQPPTPHNARGVFDILQPLTQSLLGVCNSCVAQKHTMSIGPWGKGDWVGPDLSPTGRVGIPCQKCENPCELLTLGLEQYKRKFHAEIPLVHIPTFSLEEAPPNLLLAMCLLGLSFVLTEEATTLVSRILPGLLEKVHSEVATTIFEDVTAERRLRVFATAALALALVMLTGADSSPEPVRLLYLNTLTAARQQLLFSANLWGSFDHSLSQSTAEQHDQWMNWSRVESAKRIIICLVLADTWFSEYFSTGSIVPTDDIHLFLPCDPRLFEASSASEWAKIKQLGTGACRLRFSLSYTSSNLPILQRPVNPYSLKAILCSTLLRIYDSYHRLFPGIGEAISFQTKYIPWKTFALDERAKANTGIVLEIFQLYEQVMRDDTSDSLVLWNQMGILLTTDCKLLEEAAGREGTEAAERAILKIKIWAQTPTARRACLHAAQSFKIVSQRRTLDGGSFHSPHHLFNAALVLGFYLLISPPVMKRQVTGSKELDLLDDVDWKSIANEGLVEAETQLVDRIENKHVAFIRFGGPMSLGDEPCLGGVRSAQKALLDFAGLLDNIKKWKMGDYSRLLYEMSGNLGHLHAIAVKSS